MKLNNKVESDSQVSQELMDLASVNPPKHMYPIDNYAFGPHGVIDTLFIESLQRLFYSHLSSETLPVREASLQGLAGLGYHTTSGGTPHTTHEPF